MRTAQVWRAPALTDVKGPAGGLDCPNASLPQQAIAPLARIPQVWTIPALIATNSSGSISECETGKGPSQPKTNTHMARANPRTQTPLTGGKLTAHREPN